MGQYYKTVVISKDHDCEKRIVTIDNDCKFPDWVGLKLMEHSYLNNEWTDALAYLIYRNRVRVAHVGDYADEFPQYELAYNRAVERVPLDLHNIWGKDLYDENGKLNRFDYTHKYLVNWDKNEYISFDNWKKKAFSAWSKKVYLCPFTMLTALGNGRGGGDYYEEYPNAEFVGSWAWDCISIEDNAPIDFEENNVYFSEYIEKS